MTESEALRQIEAWERRAWTMRGTLTAIRDAAQTASQTGLVDIEIPIGVLCIPMLSMRRRGTAWHVGHFDGPGPRAEAPTIQEAVERVAPEIEEVFATADERLSRLQRAVAVLGGASD